MAKLRTLIQHSGQSVEDIFSKFDFDESGSLTRAELRRALRSLSVGLTSRDIDKILEAIDKKDIKGHTRYDLVQGDLKIDAGEFQ